MNLPQKRKKGRTSGCTLILWALLVESFRMPSQFLVGKLPEKLRKGQYVLPALP